MSYIFWFFYNLGIIAGNVFIFFAQFFNTKMKLLYHGRLDTLIKTKQTPKYQKSIWIHCASLGEFEQGRPVIEALKKSYPNYPIVLSFFSPSGYEIRKDYPMVDQVIYLPSDSANHAKTLIKYYNPQLFILVKYEFWWHLLDQLQQHNVTTIVISAKFRDSNYFLKPFSISLKNILKKINIIFVQDQNSMSILTDNGFTNAKLAGDTRIDRVISHAHSVIVSDKIKHFVIGQEVIVYGSVWMEDMSVVRSTINAFPNFIHIIAPHDVNRHNILKLTNQLNQKFSLFSEGKWHNHILIIDNVGMLSSLYSIAEYAYIGGGFGAGIHNTLEPTVFGIPTIFGPKYQKFREAEEMILSGAAFSINSPDECVQVIRVLDHNYDEYTQVKVKLKAYFRQNSGATDKIMGQLAQFLDNNN